MKKYFILFLLFISLFLPLRVNAISIKKTDINIPKNIQVGETFEVEVNASLSDLKANNEGVLAVAYELSFDKDVLELIGAEADGFETTAGYADNHYIVISSVIPKVGKKCTDKFLSCASEYKSSLKFLVKGLDNKRTNIKFINLQVGAFKVDTKLNYNENNMLFKKKDLNKNEVLKINKDSNIVDVAPMNSIIELTKPSINNDLINLAKKRKEDNYVAPETKDEERLNSDKYYIKDIKIKGYKINFNKDTYKYYIGIDEKVNKLYLDIKVNNRKVKYNVSGATDLKNSNDTVTITVNNGISYYIYVERGVVKKNLEVKRVNSTSNYVIYGVCIVLAVIIIIGLIFKKRIISFINKKINK